MSIRPKTAAVTITAAIAAGSLSVGAWAATSNDHHAAKKNVSASGGAASRNSTLTAELATANSPTRSTGLLKPGQILRPGQSVRSPDKRYMLIQQADGNLVLYQGKSALWGTMTASRGAFTAMQTDGNLVLYSKAKRPIWDSTTAGNKGAFLAVQDDGNLVIYSRAKRALWSRFMYLSVLPSGWLLHPGQEVVSFDRRYALIMQNDGNLVLYRGKSALWSTATASPGAFANMQPDGNLVVYSKDKRALWGSGSAPSPGAFLAVQNDGNLVIYSRSKKPLWWRQIYNSVLPAGYVLTPGQAVVSRNRRYFLTEQTDGNLVLYKGSLSGRNNTVLWSLPVRGPNPGAFANMQKDGNFVVYSAAKSALWATGTGQRPGALLVVQDDGNAVIYLGSQALWSTGTGGR